MALKKDLVNSVSISFLLILLLLMPFLQASRAPVLSGFQGGMVAEDSALSTQELEANLVKLRFEKAAGGSAFTNTVNDSARLVPTGPDPLHHNDNPAGP